MFGLLQNIFGYYITFLATIRSLKQHLNPFCILTNPYCSTNTDIWIGEATEWILMLFKRSVAVYPQLQVLVPNLRKVQCIHSFCHLLYQLYTHLNLLGILGSLTQDDEVLWVLVSALARNPYALLTEELKRTFNTIFHLGKSYLVYAC